MTDYPFGIEIVVDPDNPQNVVRGGSVYLYDPSDLAGVAPITIKDPSGLPMTNPLTSNSIGVTNPFIATIPQVKWKSGPYEGFFDSYDGLRNEAVAAREGADVAAAAALSSGNLAVAAQASAEAAATSAAEAALAAAGGGFALDPADQDVLLISTRSDGTIIIDPSDADALLITT